MIPESAHQQRRRTLRPQVWDELAQGVPDRKRCCDLLSVSDEELPHLLAAACEVRNHFHPGVVTYSRKVFLPLTNLCRDYCGYCTFRRDPGEQGAHTMMPDEVLETCRRAEALGCREALFSLGDKPELAFPEMRATLARLGYRSTLHYLESMCELVLRETSLLPHANPGIMSAEWVERLGGVCPSLGLMLETTNDELLSSGRAHDRAPDKVPSLRLRAIADAVKRGIAFTTGILVGIGDSIEDRVNSLFTIRDLHEQYGHVQEVIIQNFRAKPDIRMHNHAEPAMAEMLRTVAVARLVLQEMNIQAPPNLSAPDYPDLIGAGINDWGGVSPLTPDFINPEAPWPHLAELEQRTNQAGFALRERLCIYPEFIPTAIGRGGLMAERLDAAAINLEYAGRAA